MSIITPIVKAVRGNVPRYRFNEDGLGTNHNSEFLKDQRFQDAYHAWKGTTSWRDVDIHWRAYVVAWAANRCAKISGDFVECGVDRGGSAMVAIKYTDFKNVSKTFWLLDTFNGLDERFVSKEEKELGILETKAKRYTECYEQVKESFKEYPNVKIIRGPIPETLPKVMAKRVAYLHVDMNCRIPEIAALTYFWDKLSFGAVVILDDYGFRGHQHQKAAFDEFAANHGMQVLCLPTGQGMLFR
jgi:hypothetical protein